MKLDSKVVFLVELNASSTFYNKQIVLEKSVINWMKVTLITQN